MNRPARSAAILLALSSLLAGAAQAQMGTPAPSGPPSAQPAPKSPSQPSADSGAAVGGPQITLPLRPPIRNTASAPDTGDAPRPTKAQALQKCKNEPNRTARRDCRTQVKRDYPPANP